MPDCRALALSAWKCRSLGLEKTRRSTLSPDREARIISHRPGQVPCDLQPSAEGAVLALDSQPPRESPGPVRPDTRVFLAAKMASTKDNQIRAALTSGANRCWPSICSLPIANARKYMAPVARVCIVAGLVQVCPRPLLPARPPSRSRGGALQRATEEGRPLANPGCGWISGCTDMQDGTGLCSPARASACFYTNILGWPS